MRDHLSMYQLLFVFKVSLKKKNITYKAHTVLEQEEVY